MTGEYPGDMDALVEEFGPGEEEISRAIHLEWERMRRRGEEIREGDASTRAFRRWFARYGAEFISALRRKGLE